MAQQEPKLDELKRLLRRLENVESAVEAKPVGFGEAEPTQPPMAEPSSERLASLRSPIPPADRKMLPIAPPVPVFEMLAPSGPPAASPSQDAAPQGPVLQDATTGLGDTAIARAIDSPPQAEAVAAAAADVDPHPVQSEGATTSRPTEIQAKAPARKSGGAMWFLALLLVAVVAGVVGYLGVANNKAAPLLPRVASLPSPEKPESKSVESPDQLPGQSEQRLPGVRELVTEPSPANRPGEIAVEAPAVERVPGLAEPEPPTRPEITAASPPPALQSAAPAEPPAPVASEPPVANVEPPQAVPAPVEERPATLPAREVAALAIEQPTPPSPVAAETAARSPRVVTAKSWAIPAGARASLPLSVEPAAAANDHYVLLSGLEPDAFVSAAIEIIGGTWMVRGTDLMVAEIERAASAPDQVPVLIELRANDGVVVGREDVMLGLQPTLGNSGWMKPQVAAAEKSAENQETPDVERLLRRGQLMLDSGSVGGARLLLERAAEMGSGEAALTLGRTYDPATLPLLGATGLSADRNLARRWYERAATLGLSEGRERLKGLERD